jgi:hypothetical protein
VAVLDFLDSLGADRGRLKVVQVEGFQDTLRLLRAGSSAPRT